MRELLRRLLAGLGDAEVRRLTQELSDARRTRAIVLRSAVRWHRTALIEKARADALATIHTKEQ